MNIIWVIIDFLITRERASLRRHDHDHHVVQFLFSPSNRLDNIITALQLLKSPEGPA